MAGKQRAYKARIGATKSLKKIFRAMELIAGSRIGRARDASHALHPYAKALTKALSAAATHIGGGVDHPLLREREDTDRVVVLVLTADRGMAGAYNASILRAADRLVADLGEQGKKVDLYCLGRRGISYYAFRGVELAGTWEGCSDSPSRELADQIAGELLARFTAKAEDGGVGAIHIVYTHFRSMVSHAPRVIRMLPLEVVEGAAAETPELFPLYAFEPGAQAVLDELLPRYIHIRILDCLLEAAVSELAARKMAMHTATENAEEVIRKFTRLANQARQAEITQEISEIVSGADALAGAKR
jgi:F-type H+-transporting ATPase subunit gamma